MFRGITVYPTAANFVLLRSWDCRPRSFSGDSREHGILVRDVSDAAQLAECLRISIGTSEDMDAVLVALEQIFSGSRKKRPPMNPDEPRSLTTRRCGARHAPGR